MPVGFIRRAALGLAIAILALGVAPLAHHSIAGVYDSNQPATIEAMVAEFHFVNPHPFVIVEVMNGGVPTERWRLELDNRFELSGVGMTADTFKPGDRVVVTGSRARNGSNGLYVRRLDRAADGFRYEQVGNSPRVTKLEKP